MSDLIVSGKDAVTGQNKVVGPNDKLVDSNGNAVTGVFDNVNVQTVIHTDGNNTADGTNGDVDNSFIQGSDNAIVASSNSFVQGLNNTNYVPNSFVQGYKNLSVMPNYPAPSRFANANLIQGYNNKSYSGYGVFIQGYDNLGGYQAWSSFMQGVGNIIDPPPNANNGWDFAQGSFNKVYGRNCFAQGLDNEINANYSFSQGASNNVNADYSLIQGGNNIVYNYALHSLVQGKNNINHVPNSFVQGLNNISAATNYPAPDPTVNGNLIQGYNNKSYASYAILMQGANNYGNAVAWYSFMQGYGNSTYDECTFVQGLNCTAGPILLGYAAFAQGNNCTVTGPRSFAQGANCEATAESSFAQGRTCEASGVASFAQGYNCTASGIHSFAHGRFCIASGANSFAVGNYSYANDNYSVVFGIGSATNTAAFAQGGSASGIYSFARGGTANGTAAWANGGSAQAFGNNSFAHGLSAIASGIDTFAHGELSLSSRAQQRTWSAGRLITSGSAQSSKITRWAETTDDTSTTLIALDLDADKSYALRGMAIARNTDTDDETASFVLMQGLVYRNAAGSAILAGADSAGEVLFTSMSVGVDAPNWDVKLVEDNNNILLQVVGSPTDTVEWCADLEFVEVLG